MSLGVRPLGFYIISFTMFAFLLFGVLSTVYEKRQEEFPMRNHPIHPFETTIVLVKTRHLPKWASMRFGLSVDDIPCAQSAAQSVPRSCSVLIDFHFIDSAGFSTIPRSNHLVTQLDILLT